MSQQPPPGSAGTPDEAPDPHGTEPTESFAQSPYDVPPAAGDTAQEPVGAAPGPAYGQAPDPTRTIYSGTSTTDPAIEPDPEPGRPRWVVPVVIVAILLLVAGGVVAAYVLGQDDEEPTPVTPTEQTTEADPTDEPTEEPTDEATATEEPTEEPTEDVTEEPTEEPTPEASTELFDDLEETVTAGDLTYELGEDGFTADEDILDQGALEAWRGQYVSGDAEIDLLATLWADNEAADAYAAELVEAIDGEEVETGFTYTNETGTFWAFLLDDGQGSYVWTTDRGHVLQVVGSTDVVGRFYSNFPL